MTDGLDKVDLETPDLAAFKRAAFEGLFPGAIADGVLDAARLGEWLDIPVAQAPDGRERYGLQWAGKHEAVRSLLTPSRAALAPDMENSPGFDNASNVFIEGDNLEVLKLLQKAYNDRIKLIYIDPPYNTGSDFVYNDDFTDGLKGYLQYTGQVDEEGHRLAAKADSTGRRHSRWLSMMYPRLTLARNLLTQDGALVVSIDENEMHALRMLLDEIFGPENHVTDVVWQKKYTRSNDARFFSDNHEYLVIYARNIDALDLKGEPRSDAQNAAYKNPDGDPNGRWKSTPLHAKSGSVTNFVHTFKNGRVWSPPVGTFPRFTHHRLDEMEAAGAIWFGANGDAQPSRKTYLKDLNDRVTPTTLWLHTEVGNTHEGNNELKEIGLGGAFNNPKPTRLIRRVLQLFTEDGDIVLDFFAGSGSTAHAVALQNAEDGARRRSISVNIPEPVGTEAARELGFEHVSDISWERIRRALDLVKENPVAGLRAFTLDQSNFRVPSSTEGELDLTESTLALDEPDWNAVAAEVLLKEGVPLHAPWTRHQLSGAEVVVVDGVAAVLTDKVSDDLVKLALDLTPRVIVFVEDAFAGADAVKANAFTNAKNSGVTLKTI